MFLPLSRSNFIQETKHLAGRVYPSRVCVQVIVRNTWPAYRHGDRGAVPASILAQECEIYPIVALASFSPRAWIPPIASCDAAIGGAPAADRRNSDGGDRAFLKIGRSARR